MTKLGGLFALFFLIAIPTVGAAELDGVTMPDTENAAGSHLMLNGIGLRTYSFLHIHIYVAGLYLSHPTADPDALIESPAPKMLRFVFLRNVDADRARRSWRDSFDRNCRAGCPVPQSDIERFLAGVPGFHKGDVSRLLFVGSALDIFMNGQLLARIPDEKFARLILALFVGPHPVSDRLKQELLGTRR
ncbi:MAG TPA: chalcone isomerase family protein [Rhodopila sp.]|nr:chalcone isomerase family protein [Rhodopila sp.]